VQMGIHTPRFAINCFKTGDDNLVGDVIEPWMYPEILPEVRKTIERRYELIPYLYSLMLEAHVSAMPVIRWVGMNYEADPEVWSNQVLKNGEEQFWLGDTLMIGGVFGPGVEEARVYLPKRSQHDPGFLNTNAPHQRLSSGGWHTISSAWKTSIPVLARVGGLVPVGRPAQTCAPGDLSGEANLLADDYRGVEIFPTPAGVSDSTEYLNSWYEDDGISTAEVADEQKTKLTVRYVATDSEITVHFDKEGTGFEPPWIVHGLIVILPVGDGRQVVSKGEVSVASMQRDDRNRPRFRLSVVG